MSISKLPALIGSALVVVSALMMQGCTLIGLAIGSSRDSSTPDSETVTSWGTDTVRAGTDVYLLLNNGTRRRGTFVGTEERPPAKYEQYYNKYLAELPSPPNIPQPGDSISFALKGDSFLYHQSLLAYHQKGLFTQINGKPEQKLILYTHIDSLNRGTSAWTGLSLRAAAREARVPLAGTIVKLESHDSTYYIPLGEIQQISWKNSKNAALTGALFGAAIDVAVIAIVASAVSSSQRSYSSGHSCPYVYSYDGKDYVFESETFSGAICRSLQRTTWDPLEHLATLGDSCALKIADELDETQYVDQLNLVAVDHPKGSQIIPDELGRVHAIGSIEKPQEVIDFDNRTVTSLVSSKDAFSWISTPMDAEGCKRDPNDAAAVRDGLIARFTRPSSSGETDQARLVITARNTPWAQELEKRLLLLQGAYLEDWYEAMNTSPEFHDSFLEIVQREAMLEVQLWDGKAWRAVASLPFPGPLIEKTFLVPLDLKAVSGPDVRVRVESTVGLWMVNSLGMSYGGDLPIHVTKAPLLRASDRSGKDLRTSLAGIDSDYYVLEQGDEARVTFSLPPAAAEDLARSFLLSSNGYYTIHVDPTGPPQIALLRSFTEEPGAFGRYSLKLFNGWLDQKLQRSGVAIATGQ